jgi:hypothetical protein
VAYLEPTFSQGPPYMIDNRRSVTDVRSPANRLLAGFGTHVSSRQKPGSC